MENQPIRNPKQNAENQQENEVAQFKTASLMPPTYSLPIDPPVQKKSENNTGLSDGVKQKMENSFGQDFSSVNIHTNSQEASSLNAQAFTQGNDIHFAPGMFDQSSKSGQELIGHELSHVVQQQNGRVNATHQEKGQNINDNDGLEKEADQHGRMASSGQKISATAGASKGNIAKTAVQRKSNVKQLYRAVPQRKETVNADPTAVFGAVMSAARAMRGGHANNAQGELDSMLMPSISGACQGPLASIPINCTTYSGFNHRWTGSITFLMGDTGTPVHSGRVTNTQNHGANTTVTQNGSDTNTGSNGLTAEGSGGGHEGAPGGKIGGSSSSGSSRTQGNTTATQTMGSGSSSSERTVNIMSSTLHVRVSLSVSYEMQGLDYINPISWGGALGNAIAGATRSSSSTKTASIGSLTYQELGGF